MSSGKCSLGCTPGMAANPADLTLCAQFVCLSIKPFKIPPHSFSTDFIWELKRKGCFFPNFSGKILDAIKPLCKRSLKHLHVCLGNRTAKVMALPEDFFQAPDWKPKRLGLQGKGKDLQNLVTVQVTRSPSARPQSECCGSCFKSPPIFMTMQRLKRQMELVFPSGKSIHQGQGACTRYSDSWTDSNWVCPRHSCRVTLHISVLPLFS